jgi:hypothetical protein
MALPPIFAHPSIIIEQHGGAPGRPGAPQPADPVPLMAHHARGFGGLAPDSAGARQSGSRVSAVTEPATSIRRRNPALAAYVAGKTDVLTAPTPPPPGVLDYDARLQRAMAVIRSNPDAVAVMGDHLMGLFNAMLLPPGSGHLMARFEVPVLRLSVILLRARAQVLEEEDDARRLLVLCDAEAAMKECIPYSDNEPRRMAEFDRSTAVSLIASLLDLRLPTRNCELSADFFETKAGT